MTTKKLLMFAAAGLLTPAAIEGSASAEVTRAVMIHSPLNDKAPVTGTPPRLKRTDEEQPGVEMPSHIVFPDGRGLYFAGTTELNGQPANRRIQGSLTTFQLEQDAAGNIVAKPNTAAAKFITNNNGNEYRQFNHSSAYALTADTGCVEYNFQPNNTNNTEKYIQCYKADGTQLLAQTKIFAKNNDDASMQQSGGATTCNDAGAGKFNCAAWRGANGNGSDDGWLQSFSLNVSATAVTFKNNFDVSVCPREERSHGLVTFGTDPNTAIATWTEGNTQPQRDGTWIAAIDVTPGKFAGANQQKSIIWKQMLRGRVDKDGLRTYSMRLAQSRVLGADLKPTDEIFLYSNDLRGNNNGNEKGGTTYRLQMGVVKATKEGVSFTVPYADMGSTLIGLGGTHLHQAAAMFGTMDKLVPGFTIQNGSMRGGGFDATQFSVGWDKTSNTLTKLGSQNVAPSDVHLYPNYLGNNPGNQGRNYLASTLIKNPIAGHKDAFLLVTASSAKPQEEMMDPSIKLTGFLTVQAVAQVAPGSGGGTGGGTGTSGGGTGGGSGTGDGTGGDDSTGSSSDTTLGGCSTGSSSTGLATFLLIGLAAFIRRRR
jgi:uncharacterized protein (TIGR03382 family)